MPRGRVADGHDDRDSGGEQRRDHQRLHQQHRTQAKRRGLQREPDRRDNAAQPPLAVAQQPHEQLDVADRFVGDGMCRALMNDVADRDEDRSAESKQDGDIRLRHRRPPVVLDKSVGKCIAKGVGAGCGDLFE
jgi:hypothetical protein